MDRQIVYPGEGLRSFDFAQAQQSMMIALGWLGQMMVGTAPVVAGLAIAPASPAALGVTIGPGILSALSVIEATPFGNSLPADVVHPLLKFGVNPTPTALAFTPPLPSGGSTTYQSFTVYASFEEIDAAALSLPFYNAAAPTQQLNGPGGNASLLPTQRQQRLVINTASGGVSASPGAALAAQGAVPTGAVALYVVTLTSGATVVTSANIAPVVSAPLADATGLGLGIRPGRFLGVQRFQQAGTFTYTPTPGARVGVVRVQAGGGGGGAAGGNSSSTMSAGQGGGAGGFTEKVVVGLTPQTVTVGAGGTAPVGLPGGNGGASSFGTIASATGGGGGGFGPPQPNPITQLGGFGVGGYASGGDTISRGGDGGCGQTNTNNPASGRGGRSRYGDGGQSIVGTGVGVSSPSAGSGGSGGASGPTAVPYGAGTGATGTVEIEEYT